MVLERMSDILALFSNGDPARQASTDDSFPPEVIALIAVCGVMFVSIIILIGFICKKTRRYGILRSTMGFKTINQVI
jgi:hypothetical protein